MYIYTHTYILGWSRSPPIFKKWWYPLLHLIQCEFLPKNTYVKFSAHSVDVWSCRQAIFLENYFTGTCTTKCTHNCELRYFFTRMTKIKFASILLLCGNIKFISDRFYWLRGSFTLQTNFVNIRQFVNHFISVSYNDKNKICLHITVMRKHKIWSRKVLLIKGIIYTSDPFC